MSFRIEDPTWLWLMLAAAPLAAVALYAFLAMSRLRRWSAIVARVLLLAVLAVALAGASSVRRVDKAALVVAVDTSGSVRSFVPPSVDAQGKPVPILESLQKRLMESLSRNAGKLGPDDRVALITFDGGPRALAAPFAPSQPPTDRPIAPSLMEGSDLAAAIRAAGAALPPDVQGRLLIVSDGLASGGSGGLGDQEGPAAALGAARAMFSATKAPIDVLPLRYVHPREVTVDSLDAPMRVATDRAPVPLTLTLTSTNPGPVRGRLRLMQEGQPVPLPPQAESVTLQPGRNVLTLRVPLSPGRLHRFEAVYEPEVAAAGDEKSDTVAANNRAVAFTTSPGGGRVLLVDGTGATPPAAAPLAAALNAAGVAATVTLSTAFDTAADLLSLQAYDLVVLVDVPADALSASSQQNLASYVSDTGGGLLMVAGPPPTANSFGAGGWKGTPIEPLLPVTLDLPDRLVMPSTAVVIVLDSSGSMGFSVMGSSRSQQQIANQGAAAALGALDKQDLVGVIEFNSSSSWVVPLHANSDPQVTGQKIMGISPGGGTNLPPALEMAYAALQPVKAAVKHVIVLSDGQSQGRRKLAAIAQKFKDAPGGPIKISTIAVGDDADTQGLEQLARGGGGEYFRVVDPSILPRIFVKAVRVVRTPLIREEVFTPVPGPGASVSAATAGMKGGLPSLGGVILTQPRLDAEKKNVEGVTYALLTPQGEPLLAHWRVGLGQVGAFTSSPLGSGWAKGWATPEGGGAALWVQLARSLSRSAEGGGGENATDLSARIDGETVKVRVETGKGKEGGSGPAPKVSVYDPAGRRVDVAVSLTAPGVYEGSVPAPAESGEGVYVITVAPMAGNSGGPIIGGVVKTSAAAAEYRVPRDGTSAAGTALLKQIAAETGGRVLSLADLSSMDAPGLFVREKVEPRESRTPLWPILVMVACGVLMLDIATRRIAWDRAWGGGSEADEGRKSSSAVRRPASTSSSDATAPRPEPDSPLAAAKRRARQETDGA